MNKGGTPHLSLLSCKCLLLLLFTLGEMRTRTTVVLHAPSSQANHHYYKESRVPSFGGSAVHSSQPLSHTKESILFPSVKKEGFKNYISYKFKKPSKGKNLYEVQCPFPRCFLGKSFPRHKRSQSFKS